ncbi:MAG: hypothetical protein PVI99_01425 [Anaerolineales bacterium]|jgi:hypothetical protein
MKYEEWIQYEHLRQAQPDSTTWISLEPDLLTQKMPPTSAAPSEPEKNRVWTFIIQVVNSSRI